jgi:hypothetical protein
MDHDREERIRQRAHKMWEDDGRPEGREGEHWDRAMREIDGNSGGGGNGQAQRDAGNQTLREASASSGVATGLQAGGTSPGGGPGAGLGSIGTGGGSTANKPSGQAKQGSR